MRATEQIAVDIVLLTPEPIIEASIATNTRLVERTGNRKVVLDRQHAIPHISLAMGTVERSDLAALGQGLDDIVHRYLPLETTLTELAAVTTETGDIVSGFNVRRTDEVQALHEAVMKQLLAFDTGTVAVSMIAGWEHEAITAFTTRYIGGFSEHSAYGNYSPHITLGYGDAREDFLAFSFPLPFLCTSAAVCHLGNYCTCREILSVHPPA
jgi:2'-5' RNA ligase